MFTTGFTDFQGACSARREWSVWASAAISDFKTIMLPVALLGILRAHPSKKGFFTHHNRPSRRCQIQMFLSTPRDRFFYPGHDRTHTAVAGWRENELRSCPPRASDSEAAGCQQCILHTSRTWKRMGQGHGNHAGTSATMQERKPHGLRLLEQDLELVHFNNLHRLPLLHCGKNLNPGENG